MSNSLEDIPIPYKLYLENFGSHEKTEIILGEPSENCFISGSSGRGKTHIIRAIQCALGNKPNQDKEIFSYEYVSENGTRRKKFRNTTKITLVLKNSGKNFLHMYPKDAEISIVVELFRNNARKNKWYVIDHEGVRDNKSKDEIKRIFGDGLDPLIFIPQGQTSKFIQKSPADRYTEVSKFIGIENSQKEVEKTLKDLNEAEGNFVNKNNKMEILASELKVLESKYNQYQEKLTLIKKIQNFETDYNNARIHELYEEFEDNNKKLNETYYQIENLEVKITNTKKDITDANSTIEKIQNDIRDLEEELKTKSTIRNSNLVKITSWENSTKEILNLFKAKTDELKNRYSKEEIKDKYSKLSKENEELSIEIVQLKKVLAESNDELNALNHGRLKISTDYKTLHLLLKEQNIPNNYLYELIDFKSGQEKWRDVFESIMGNQKKAVVVPEEYQKRAESINRNNNLNTTIFSPRKKYVQNYTPDSRLRNWQNILNIQPDKISKETALQVLHFIIGGTYFPENPNELDQYRNIIPHARYASLDGYFYTLISQSKIHFLNEYFIGRGAIKHQIKVLEEKIKKTKDDLRNLETDKKTLEKNKNSIEKIIEFFDLQDKEGEINDLRSENEELKKSIDTLNYTLYNPNLRIEQLTEKIKTSHQNLISLTDDVKTKRDDFKDLQILLQNLTELFKDVFTKWYMESEHPEFTEDPIEYFVTIEDEDINYESIIDKIKDIIQFIPEPTKKSEVIQTELSTTKTNLQDHFEKYSEDDKKNYLEANEQMQILSEEIINLQNEIKKCQDQFEKAEYQLRTELEKWRGKVSSNFKKAMQLLELDGSLRITRETETSNFELQIYVANQTGGVEDRFEDSNFSGGEEQRVAVAFMTAIISQSSYPYVIWDEFDSHVGDDIREKYAILIDHFFTERKLIALSPQDIVNDYLRVFPHVLEIWKNDDKFSRITVYRSDKKKTLKGDLTDVL